MAATPIAKLNERTIPQAANANELRDRSCLVQVAKIKILAIIVVLCSNEHFESSRNGGKHFAVTQMKRT